LDFNELKIGELKNLTTYRIIKGARQFIVGAVIKQSKAMEDYGYYHVTPITSDRDALA
jgi:hypothetical protein